MNTFRSLVLVSTDPISLEKGSEDVYTKLQSEIERFGLQEEIALRKIEDVGRNDCAPIVIVYPEAVVYGPVTPEDVPFLVEEHLYKGRVAPGLQAAQRTLSGRIAWISARKGSLPAENRVVLQRAGIVDPESIEDYIMHDGFEALAKAITEMTPQQVIDEIKNSGLRGRGGAGFPTAMKWGFVAKAHGNPKYVVCNADESEPGTFKDRVILEGDPFNMIEAMSIAAYAVGASEGYVYIRGEYALAQKRLKGAIQQAESRGLLGDNIFGTDFSFHLHIHSGAGAYICGEETALLESIEGRRGEPRNRPPYPVTVGLWGKPTLVNNVETLANVTPIIRNGANWYRRLGTINSPGTKVYTILGNVNNTGLIEVPMGITLREVISIYANGMKNDATFKLAQTGGSSGSIIPASLQDTPMDYDSFSKAGVSLGSGALLICDEGTCVVDLAKVLMNFFRKESCGKCSPCRVGTQRCYEYLDAISKGTGSLEDLQELLVLTDNMGELSNCGLGQTAGTPVRDILKHFRAEVEAHIRLKVCPVGICEIKQEVS